MIGKIVGVEFEPSDRSSEEMVLRIAVQQGTVWACSVSVEQIMDDSLTVIDEEFLTVMGARESSCGCWLGFYGSDPDQMAVEWILDSDSETGVGAASLFGTDQGDWIKTRRDVRELLRALRI